MTHRISYPRESWKSLHAEQRKQGNGEEHKPTRSGELTGKPLKIMGTNSTDHDVNDEVKRNNDVRCVPSIQDLTP